MDGGFRCALPTLRSKASTSRSLRITIAPGKPSRGLHMTRALAFATALVAIAASLPAKAGALWPDVPPEIGVRRIGELGLVPYRCADGLADNYYHGAWYDVPPAVYRGYVYRPYYRYTAYRVIPRNYFCTER